MDPSSCHARRRSRSSGERAQDQIRRSGRDAAQILPEKVTLPNVGEFKLIGTPAKRIDTPSKVNGTGIKESTPTTGLENRDARASPVFAGD